MSSTILLLSLIFLPVRVRGQETTTTPSLEDTLNFIKEQLGDVSLSSRYQIQGTGDFTSPVDGKVYPNVLNYGVEEYYSFQNSDVSYSGCELSITETNIKKWNSVDHSGWGKAWRGGSTTVWRVKIPLSKMSVKGVKVVEYDPHSDTRAGVKQATAGAPLNLTILQEGEKFFTLVLPMSGARKMEMTKSVDGKAEAVSGSEENTYFATSELANRLAKAFAHAMTLCGSKDDPF